MPSFSRTTFILKPPPGLPHLHLHFAGLASQDGYVLHFLAVDEATGEKIVVKIEPPPDPPKRSP